MSTVLMTDSSASLPAAQEMYLAQTAALLEMAEWQGGNCIKIGLPGKLILSKIKSLLEALFS